MHNNYNWRKKEIIHESPVRIWLPVLKMFPPKLQNMHCRKTFVPKTSNPFLFYVFPWNRSQNMSEKGLNCTAIPLCVVAVCFTSDRSRRSHFSSHHDPFSSWRDCLSHRDGHNIILVTFWSFSYQFITFHLFFPIS